MRQVDEGQACVAGLKKGRQDSMGWTFNVGSRDRRQEGWQWDGTPELPAWQATPTTSPQTIFMFAGMTPYLVAALGADHALHLPTCSPHYGAMVVITRRHPHCGNLCYVTGNV